MPLTMFVSNSLTFIVVCLHARHFTEAATVVEATTSSENVAIVKGQAVPILCKGETQDVAWFFITAGSSAAVAIAANCQLFHQYSNTYGLDTSNGACNLIIISPSVNEAGTYTCLDTSKPSSPKAAEVIVLDAHMACSVNATSPVVTGAGVQITAAVKYLGNIQPQIRWTGNSADPVVTRSGTSPKVVESRINIVAGSSNSTFYSAELYFNTPEPTSYRIIYIAAANAPSYKEKCSFQMAAEPPRGCPEIPHCTNCSSFVKNGQTQFKCNQCNVGYGTAFAADGRSYCKACSELAGCVLCTNVTMCETCRFIRQDGPDMNGQGTCSACAPNCTYCGKSGSKKCDACVAGYAKTIFNLCKAI